MIYLSALPDTNYFIWQIQVQLKNFRRWSIPANSIHIIIGYHKEDGINYNFLQLAKEYEDYACFFFYEDTRFSKAYLSSIRPHVIKKHFAKYVTLADEVIFYHDSDIVFTNSIPDFDKFSEGTDWYVSDTRNYIGLEYLEPFGGNVLNKMCEIVDIDIRLVKQNDENAGGAQYILKGVDYDFWNTCEIQCEKLFSYLSDPDLQDVKKNYSIRPKNQLQAWCADMWVVLWNGFKRATVKIDPELDFCWPHEPLANWDKKRIFHNAGVVDSQKQLLFYKSQFNEVAPYHRNLTSGLFGYCSDNYIEMIREVEKLTRYDAKDTTFIILARIDSQSRLENLAGTVNFISKNFDTTIFLLEADEISRIPDHIKMTENVRHYFVQDKDVMFDRTLYTNVMASLAGTEIIVKYDADIVVSPDQLHKSICAVRHKAYSFSYPFDGTVLNVTGEFREYFLRLQKTEILYKHQSKLDNYGFLSVGGCIVSNKAEFLKIGGENEAFGSWGHEDQELFNRYRILGYRFNRQAGPLFHLAHERTVNSYYTNKEAEIKSYKEFMDTSGRDKKSLQEKISKWDYSRRKAMSRLVRKSDSQL